MRSEFEQSVDILPGPQKSGVEETYIRECGASSPFINRFLRLHLHRISIATLCEIQLYALIFALPFEYYLAGRTQFLFTSLKVQLALLFLTWIGATSLRFFEDKKRVVADLAGLVPRRLVISMILFVSVQILASALAPSFRHNAVKASGKAALGALLAIAAADICSKSDRKKGRIKGANAVLMLSLAGACVAFLGFGELAGIDVFERVVKIFQPSRYFLANHLRFVSTMEYPNTAASFLTAALCATLAFDVFPLNGSSALKWLRWALLVLLGAAVSFTYSRGAIAATMIGIAVAIWTVRRRFSPAVQRGGMVISLSVLFLGLGLAHVVRQEPALQHPAKTRIVHYGMAADGNTKSLLADHKYTERIAVQNQSSEYWHGGINGLAYRWYDFGKKQRTALQFGGGFDGDVGPAESVTVQVSLNTPQKPGEYLLIWFVFVRGNDIQELPQSYSPGIPCTIRSAQSEGEYQLSDQTSRYAGAIREERRLLNNATVPARSELWRAATRMFMSRPLLGVGPDNFRLRKWKFMNLPEGDDTILANNLYLEFLAGSGLVGLATFLWFAWEFMRLALANFSPKAGRGSRITGFFGSAYLTAFLAHGFVDYFLKFTPIALLFWTTLGVLCAERQHSEEDESADCL